MVHLVIKVFDLRGIFMLKHADISIRTCETLTNLSNNHVKHKRNYERG